MKITGARRSFSKFSALIMVVAMFLGLMVSGCGDSGSNAPYSSQNVGTLKLSYNLVTAKDINVNDVRSLEVLGFTGAGADASFNKNFALPSTAQTYPVEITGVNTDVNIVEVRELDAKGVVIDRTIYNDVVIKKGQSTTLTDADITTVYELTGIEATPDHDFIAVNGSVTFNVQAVYTNKTDATKANDKLDVSTVATYKSSATAVLAGENNVFSALKEGLVTVTATYGSFSKDVAVKVTDSKLSSIEVRDATGTTAVTAEQMLYVKKTLEGFKPAETVTNELPINEVTYTVYGIFADASASELTNATLAPKAETSAFTVSGKTVTAKAGTSAPETLVASYENVKDYEFTLEAIAATAEVGLEAPAVFTTSTSSIYQSNAANATVTYAVKGYYAYKSGTAEVKYGPFVLDTDTSASEIAWSFKHAVDPTTGTYAIDNKGTVTNGTVVTEFTTNTVQAVANGFVASKQIIFCASNPNLYNLTFGISGDYLNSVAFFTDEEVTCSLRALFGASSGIYSVDVSDSAHFAAHNEIDGSSIGTFNGNVFTCKDLTADTNIRLYGYCELGAKNMCARAWATTGKTAVYGTVTYGTFQEKQAEGLEDTTAEVGPNGIDINGVYKEQTSPTMYYYGRHATAPVFSLNHGHPNAFVLTPGGENGNTKVTLAAGAISGESAEVWADGKKVFTVVAKP